MTDTTLNKNKKYIIKRSEEPSNRPTKSLKKVNFKLNPCQKKFDSEIESDSNAVDRDINNSGYFGNSSAENIVMLKPQRNLDSSLPHINQKRRERTQSARGSYLPNRSLERDRRLYYRDLTPVNEIIDNEESVSNEVEQMGNLFYRNRSKSAVFNKSRRPRHYSAL